jgi:hypothetical protein
MGIAFEMALVALRLADRGDLANEVVARQIINLAKAGERDPERLWMKEFRAPAAGVDDGFSCCASLSAHTPLHSLAHPAP